MGSFILLFNPSGVVQYVRYSATDGTVFIGIRPSLKMNTITAEFAKNLHKER